MGAIGKALLTQLGTTAVSELAKQGGYAIGKLTGYSDAVAKDQLEQQRKLTDIQQNANFQSMDKQQAMQKEMFEHTFDIQSKYNSAAQQVQRYKEAGLNPALMYTNGSAGMAGGTTGGVGMGSVSGGSASDEASRKAIDLQMQGMALQNAKLASEIEVNKSVANNNNANANTTNSTRDILIENMTQTGESQWLQNVITKFNMQFDATDKETAMTAWNKYFGDIWLSADSTKKQELANVVLKTAKEIETMGKTSDAAMMNAEAAKLSAEFNTGSTINWKNVGDILTKLLPMLLRGK